MARRARTRVATGIYQDEFGFTIRVSVHGVPHEGPRHPLGTPLDTLVKARRAFRREIEDTPAPQRHGTLAANVASYLATLPTGRTRNDAQTLLEHWKAAGFYDRAADAIEPSEILTQLKAWTGRFKPKTLNELRRLLGSVYIAKNGKSGHNPVRDVPRERVVYDDPRGFAYPLINTILNLMPDRGQGRKGQPRSTVNLTKLRLRVIAYTGLHQSEIAKLTERDLRELAHKRVWVEGRLKGGGTRAGWHPLTEAGVNALRALREAGGLGPFGTRSMAYTWRRAIVLAKQAWTVAHPREPWPLPDNVRPYDLRHSYGTAVYRQTKDIRAAQKLLRHTTLATTLRYTAAAVDELAQLASDALEPIHRGATTVPRAGGTKAPKRTPMPRGTHKGNVARKRRKSGKSSKD